MQQWEYWTVFIYASSEKENVKKMFPEWTPKTKYHPLTLVPDLDALGRDGWELVHMEPAAVLEENNVMINGGQYAQRTNWYFCVFKRPEPDQDNPQ